MLKLLVLCSVLSFNSAWALVDYADDTPPISSNKGMKSSTTMEKAPARSGNRPRGGRGLIEVTSAYQSTKMSTPKYNGKVDKMDANLLLQTPYDLFLELGYWQGRSNGNFSDGTGWQRGNMRGMLGVTWLKWGGREEESRVNILAGGMLGEKQSTLASSRTDKIFGLETTKNIASMILGLSGEYRMVGTPTNEIETRIGNISKATAALGIPFTSDIRFSLETSYVKIAAADTKDEMLPRLKESTSFSVLSPKLHLNLADYIQIQLGANFRTKKPNSGTEDALVGARLWDFPWAFGNSFIFGMGVSI